MAILEFPDPLVTNPWLDPSGVMWVHDSEGWSTNITGVITQETAPDLAQVLPKTRWIRSSDLITFVMYESVERRQWVEAIGAAGNSGSDSTDGADGVPGADALDPYISDGADGFVSRNWAHDLTNDGAYTDSGVSADGADGEGAAIGLPPGVLFDWAGTTAPAGSLSCNGQELAQATYPELYAAIGDLWAITGDVAPPAAGNFRVPPQKIGGFGVFRRALNSSNTGTYANPTSMTHTHTVNHNHTGVSVNVSTTTNGEHTHNVAIAGDIYNVTSEGEGGKTPFVRGSSYNTRPAGAHGHSVTGSSVSVDNTNVTTGSYGNVEMRPESITLLLCIWI